MRLRCNVLQAEAYYLVGDWGLILIRDASV